MRERREIVVEEHRVIAGLNIERELPFRRRVLHHYVHGTAYSVTFEVGRQRLVNLKTVEHLRRENVERHETVLIVGARYLDSVDESVVVAFVHAAEDGILPFPHSVALDGNARHTLYHIRHRLVGRQFDSTRAHHIHDIRRTLLDVARGSLRTAMVAAYHLHLGKHLRRRFKLQIHRGIFLPHLYLRRLIAHIRAYQRIGVGISGLQRIASVQSGDGYILRVFFYRDVCPYELFSSVFVRDLTLYCRRVSTIRKQKKQQTKNNLLHNL